MLKRAKTKHNSIEISYTLPNSSLTTSEVKSWWNIFLNSPTQCAAVTMNFFEINVAPQNGTLSWPFMKIDSSNKTYIQYSSWAYIQYSSWAYIQYSFWSYIQYSSWAYIQYSSWAYIQYSTWAYIQYSSWDVAIF